MSTPDLNKISIFSLFEQTVHNSHKPTFAWMNILYISGRITGASCGICLSPNGRTLRIDSQTLHTAAEGLHHSKSFHFPVAVSSPLIIFSEVQFFIPVTTLIAPWTKLPSPLVNACIRFPKQMWPSFQPVPICYGWDCICLKINSGNKYKSTSIEEDLQMSNYNKKTVNLLSLFLME